MINIGTQLPDLLGKDAEGKEIRISGFPDKKIILYFYPKDNTPGCTAEACDLRDNFRTLYEMGYQVIGVSKDSEASHQKFAAKYELPFPLIADTDLTLAMFCGVWQKKKMAGREYFGIVRTTFVLDNKGVVTDIIEKVKTKEAADQLFKLLEGRDNPNPA